MEVNKQDSNSERLRIRFSFYIPTLFIAIIWLIKFAEISFDMDLSGLGIYPRKFFGMIGIVTAPMIHSDLAHLFSNTIPLLLLFAGSIYFYRAIAFRVFFLIWLINGIGTWLIARPSFHIGASGLIYGLVCFVFFSGIIRMNFRLLAISMLVTFLYGSMVWGILPELTEFRNISWESHLTGSLAGIFCAIYFRNLGLQRERYDWQDEEDDEDDGDYIEFKDVNDEPKSDEQVSKIRYIYKPRSDDRGTEDRKP